MGKAENLFFLFFSFRFFGFVQTLARRLSAEPKPGQSGRRWKGSKEKHGKSSGRAHANCDTGSAGAAAEGAAGATGKGSQAEATMWPKIQKGRADKRLTTLGGTQKGIHREKRRGEERGGKSGGRGE